MENVMVNYISVFQSWTNQCWENDGCFPGKTTEACKPSGTDYEDIGEYEAQERWSYLRLVNLSETEGENR